jgi:hypothetical protein
MTLLHLAHITMSLAFERWNEHNRTQGTTALLPCPVIAHRHVRHPVPGSTCQCSLQWTFKLLGIVPQYRFQWHLSQEGESLRLHHLQSVRPTWLLLGQPIGVDGHEAWVASYPALVFRLSLTLSVTQGVGVLVPAVPFLHFQHTGYWSPWHSSGVSCPVTSGLAAASRNLWVVQLLP